MRNVTLYGVRENINLLEECVYYLINKVSAVRENNIIANVICFFF